MNYFKYLMVDGHSEHDVSRFTQEMLLENNEDRITAKRGVVEVGFASNAKAQRRRVGEVRLTLCGRSATFTAVLLPERYDAPTGVLVLETLDLLVDPVACRLVPRDPEMPTSMIDTAETVLID